ncbi:hypothetical protein [Actinomadura sp. NPDC049753]|uniref:hypothetical protein n=1 Tax=Actinomadura sp. NPDC049753 TaxID=3154739 RepID=UPI0034345748
MRKRRGRFGRLPDERDQLAARPAPRFIETAARRVGIVRTARKLFDGTVFPPEFRMSVKHEIAHVAHVELLTPEPDRSLWFFTRVMGLTEVGAEGDSVYLRTWDDYGHHILKLTAHTTSGIRRTGLRASSRQALDRRVAAIEDAGLGVGWRDGDPGIGPTTCSATPTATSWRSTGSRSGTRRRRSCGRR